MNVRPKVPNRIDVEVGQRIKLQRKVKGMSQTALADALEITFQQVQKYEKGSNRVGASRLSNIASILEVPVSYFFDGLDKVPDTGVATAPAVDELTQFLATAEGVALNAAFASIGSVKIRRKIVAIVRAIAETDNDSTD